MPKLNLLEILKNTIVEQTPPGMYGYDVDPEYQTIDVDTGKSSFIGSPKKEDLKKLDVIPTMGKCKGWKRSTKYGFKNGDPNASYLISLKNHPSVKLNKNSAKDFNNMEFLYKSETGNNFGNLSGFRTYDQQWEIFDLEYCIETGISRKVGTVDIPVAKPGKSNHGTGDAIDVEVQNDQSWIKQKGILYGWCHGEAPEEPWHFTHDLIHCK